MACATPAKPRALPTDRTIALAIAVVQSKPKDLTVREYIQLLRQHITAGRRQDTQNSSYRHLDTSAYWHSQYQRLEGLLKAAQGEAIDLKIEVENLNEQLKETRPKTVTMKRKQDGDVVRVERTSKRGKQSATPIQKSIVSSPHGADFDFSGLGTAGQDLMRSFYQVNSVLNNYQKTDPDLLAQRCVIAASTISQVVCEASKKEVEASSKLRYPLKDVLTASSRVILCLTMGLNRVTRVAEGAHIQGRVIYAYVHMFSQGLDALSEVSDFQAKGFTTSTAPPKVQEAVSLLAAFLCDILKGLNPDIEAHKALFEGYAYFVLKKVGSNLHTSVFGHARLDSLEAEISMGCEQRADKNRRRRQMEPNEVKAAKIEAPYLAQLLECMLAVAPAYLEEVSNAKGGKSKTTKATGSSKRLLTNGAKERLQGTLIRCMFGTQGAEDNTFKDCLQMPVMNNAQILAPVKESNGQEWFTEVVWRLLGWDILSREVA